MERTTYGNGRDRAGFNAVGGKRLALATSLCLLLSLLVIGSVAAQVVRPPWRAQTAELPRAEITVGNEPLTVEIAAEPAAKSRGLGYRAGLEPSTGMLFVDEEAEIQSFWMRGMRFCLDIVWIDGDQIVGAAESACPDPPGTVDADRARYVSPQSVPYVLEVPAGWLADHGFGVGTPVTLPAGLATDA